MPWLLKAWHTPRQSEAWMARFPSWANADPAHIDLFARAFADKWQANLATNNAAWAIEHAAAAQRWARHRYD